MGGYANGTPYAASKGRVTSLTYNLAHKLAKIGITVNCVEPGTVETEMINRSQLQKSKIFWTSFHWVGSKQSMKLQ